MFTIKFYFSWKTYTAAPTTDKATDKPIPIVAHMWGEVSSRNLKFNLKNPQKSLFLTSLPSHTNPFPLSGQNMVKSYKNQLTSKSCDLK